MDMATLSNLIQKWRNLSVVDLQNFPIDRKQAYQLLNSLDKSRIDSVKFPPIFIYFSKEQQHDFFDDTVLSSYQERNLYVVFGK